MNIQYVRTVLEVMKLAKEVELTSTENFEIRKYCRAALQIELGLDSDGSKVESHGVKGR